MNVHTREFAPHPAAEIFPLLDEARLAELAADIEVNGLREPIRLLDGRILDGRNRLAACRLAGVEPRFTEVPEGTNPWALTWSLNGQRRDLNADQRYLLWRQCADEDAAWQAEQGRIAADANRRRAEAAKVQIASQVRDEAGKVQPGGATYSGTTRAPGGASKPRRSTDIAAAAANVDRGTVERVEWLERHRPDLHARVRSGELSSYRAYTQAKREAKLAALEDVSAREAKAAAGLYDVIVLDPPWPMQKIEREVRPNQAALDYPTMSEAELAALTIPAAPDCHVWCWTTHRFLPMALRLLEAWRLRYVCYFIWHKPGGFQPIGLPQFNCEMVLYARKGAPSFLDTKAFPTCFEAPRGAHSEKPGAFYELIRRVTGGRRLDMFSRRPIPGFDGWGFESGG